MRLLQAFACIVMLYQGSVFAQDDTGTTSSIYAEGDGVVAPDSGVSVTVDDPLVTLPRDIVLALDNSGSMKIKDPEFQIRAAISDFISQLGAETNLGIIVFDQQIRLAVTLTSASVDNQQRILSGLEQLNYNGLFRDIPTAIERAVTELRNNGREEAAKHIIFITDGVLETDNNATQLERSEWLLNELAEIAVASDIRISGIGIAENADMNLIQALAGKTGGDAYQLMDINELEDLLSSVENDTRQETVISAPTPQVAATPPQVSAQSADSTAEGLAGTPVQDIGQEERVRSIIIIVAAGILVITLGTLIILLIKRSRDYKKGLQSSASEAWLNDINRYTSKSSYKLGKKATMLGRVAGKDAGHLDYVVIPESTIGRRHAVIEYKDYGYWIVDQGSINGTFVNDVRVNGDTRLKHSDRIRLHKFEFEFIMPDLEEAGVTRLSPAAAGDNGTGAEEVEAVKAGMAADSFSLDLDFSGEVPESENVGGARSDEKDDTLMPGYDTQAGEHGDTSEDKTLMPDFDKASAETGASAETADSAGEQSDPGQDDETLMPGHFKESDDDATIRPDQGISSGKTGTQEDKDK